MKSILSILFILSYITISLSREVSLSAGIGGYNHSQLWSEFTAFKAYRDIGMITTASILAYYIAEDGSLAAYETGDSTWSTEQYQQDMTTKLKLNSAPCIYCDATIGNCQGLSQRLQNLYANEQAFITDTLNRAKMYNYSGYFIDLEPDDQVDPTNVTDFIINWGSALNDYGLTLDIWIGGNTPYDMNRLYNSSVVNLVTMDTYNTDYETFINLAAPLQTSMTDITKLGFGLLTNYGREFKNNINSTDVTDISGIVAWSVLSKVNQLSLWASHIPPEWYAPLIAFSNSK